MESITIELRDKAGRAYEVLLDAADAHLVSRHSWRICAKGYAHRKCHGKFIYLHRVILAAAADQHVDHIDGNPRDNRRTNLRFCTRSQNMHNQRLQTRSTTGFKGVSRRGNRFRAAITVNGKLAYLGLFDDARVAAHAYNRAAIQLRGEFASLNPY